MKVDTWIASVAWDYPGLSGPDDTKIPLASVWFRVAYGLGYLGDAEVRRLRDIYEGQGIGFYGVIVPTGSNWAAQRNQALAAIRLCRGLEFDVEPYGQYLGSEAGLQAWLKNVLMPLRYNHAEELKGKDISLCYDPREWWLDGWQFARAVSLSDSLAPMVYTGMFAAHAIWGDPIKAIQQARQQCPVNKVFRPILQTYAIDPAETLASFGEAVRLDGKPILFRRGVTPTAIWRAIETIAEGPVMVPAVSYPVPPKEVEMSSQEYNQLNQKIDDQHNWVQLSVHDALEARLANLEREVQSLKAAPPRQAGWDVLRQADGHATGFAARNGISVAQLKALNPQGPPSGDWDLVHAGERYRVA